MPSTCLPASLILAKKLCELTENCFAVFDQSSHAVLLTWYCQLYFFPWISHGYSIDGSWKIFDKTIWGEHNSILLHFCKLRKHIFFLFQSLDVWVSENLSDSPAIPCWTTTNWKFQVAVFIESYTSLQRWKSLFLKNAYKKGCKCVKKAVPVGS